MDAFLDIHNRFFRDTLELNKYGNHIVTVVPSVVFLLSNFLFIYKFCHRYTSIGYTPLKTWIFRELTFQWTFFYLAKLWFIFTKAYKITVNKACAEIIDGPNSTFNKRQCNLFGLFILSVIATIPFAMLMIKTLARTRIPNFLMWVGEDPWLRTEIGLAGHYLDRPPRFLLPKRKDCAYHTRRSSSAEEAHHKGTYLRISKSLDSSKCNKKRNIQRG